MTVISNHIYETAPLRAGLLVDRRGSLEAFTSQRVLNIVDSCVCEAVYCAGEHVHFQPLFQERPSPLH